jgi:hypothetical protein
MPAVKAYNILPVAIHNTTLLLLLATMPHECR